MPKVNIIDLQFMGIKETIATYLIKSKSGHVLFDPGPASTFDNLKKALAKLKVKPEDIKHVFVTHVHLDHAGAAWCLAEFGAKIYVHKKGAKHLKQPKRLWASAERIYGKEMQKLWGEMRPIPAEQIVVLDHKKSVRIDFLRIRALYTPGHASHHVSWESDEYLFVGDVGGVKINGGPSFPPCPPPDIDIEAWKKSLSLLRSRRPSKIFLTHFGEVTDYKTHFTELQGRLDNLARFVQSLMDNGLSEKKALAEYENYIDLQMKSEGVKASMRKQYEAANPSWMSFEGLMRYWRNKE